jgi:pimeloyl-ACP methyl ester carboxylesterase
MPTFHANGGTSLFYRDFGRGQPILFLSGLGLGSQMWNYHFAAFAEHGFRCLGFDRPGHDRSDQPAGGYDFDTFADDIAVLIAVLDLRDLTPISHSTVSDEARYLSRHAQERLARIVLLAPTTPRLLKGEDNPESMPPDSFEALWAQWKRDYPKWIADNLAPFFIPETSYAMMRWAASLLTVSVPVALACSRAVANADFRQEMREIDAPCLLIQGDRDRSAPVETTGKTSAELLRSCRLLIYQSAPHRVMFTHMDQLHADILQFIKQTQLAAS